MITDKSSLQLNPSAISPDKLANILTAAGGQHISAEMIKMAIECGLAADANGNINLIELMAWLEKQLSELK